MHQISVMPFRARKKYGVLVDVFCGERHSREALEEIENHCIKEKEAWRYFFAEINNNYLEEEITWIRTIIPLG